MGNSVFKTNEIDDPQLLWFKIVIVFHPNLYLSKFQPKNKLVNLIYGFEDNNDIDDEEYICYSIEYQDVSLVENITFDVTKKNGKIKRYNMKLNNIKEKIIKLENINNVKINYFGMEKSNINNIIDEINNLINKNLKNLHLEH